MASRPLIAHPCSKTFAFFSDTRNVTCHNQNHFGPGVAIPKLVTSFLLLTQLKTETFSSEVSNRFQFGFPCHRFLKPYYFSSSNSSPARCSHDSLIFHRFQNARRPAFCDGIVDHTCIISLQIR